MLGADISQIVENSPYKLVSVWGHPEGIFGFNQYCQAVMKEIEVSFWANCFG